MKAFEDITGCREAQAGIRASEIRYRRLFEAARDGMRRGKESEVLKK
jgi:hypothetical protein